MARTLAPPAIVASSGARPVAPRAWLLWAVTVAGIGMTAGTLVVALVSAQLERPALRAFLVGWVVIPFMASGAVGWWRRPESRLGPLMLVTGLVMALTPLQWSTNRWLHSLGHLLDMLPAAMFLHVFLAFPTGRLRHRPERVLITAGYVAALGLQTLKILVGADPDSLFAVVVNPRASSAAEGIQLGAVAALMLVAAVLLYVRRRRSRSVRRPAALVADSFTLALVMLALLFVAGLTSSPAADTIRLITFATLGLAPLAFLFALLDARLARGAVARLLLELRDRPFGELRGPLGLALHDPSVQVAYWLPQLQRWVDDTGAPVPTPQPDEQRAVRILQGDSSPMAALTFDRALEDEHELVDAVAAAASIAVENARLRAELRGQLQEVERSRSRVLEAGRLERQRLERNLHDGAQQQLVALSLELDLLRDRSSADPELRHRLGRAKSSVSTALTDLRDIARGIYPAVLTGHGLQVAIESLADRAAVPLHVDVDLDTRPPEAVEVGAYYVVSEALTNIDRHAGATSATVRVRGTGSCLVVDVTDNGTGLTGHLGQGSGLRGLSDRVQALGGQLEVGPAPHAGTRVHAEIPCR